MATRQDLHLALTLLQAELLLDYQIKQNRIADNPVPPELLTILCHQNCKFNPTGEMLRGAEMLQEAMTNWKSGKAQILVATDVAARGLHIKNLPYVINYDFPTNLDTYIHRVGRTGRLATDGHAYSFFTRNLAPVAQPLLALLKVGKHSRFTHCVFSCTLKKRKGKSTPFGVNFMRSQVLYRAAQVH